MLMNTMAAAHGVIVGGPPRKACCAVATDSEGRLPGTSPVGRSQQQGNRLAGLLRSKCEH
jgi:hypothetical protein